MKRVILVASRPDHEVKKSTLDKFSAGFSPLPIIACREIVIKHCNIMTARPVHHANKHTTKQIEAKRINSSCGPPRESEKRSDEAGVHTMYMYQSRKAILKVRKRKLILFSSFIRILNVSEANIFKQIAIIYIPKCLKNFVLFTADGKTLGI